MADIVRCPHCLSLVYEGSEHCHHCGEAVKKHRIFSRGAILFVIVAIAGFGVYDVVSLLAQRRSTELHDRAAFEALSRHLLEKASDRSEQFWNGRLDGDQELASLARGCQDLREEVQKNGAVKIQIENLDYLGRKDMVVQMHPSGFQRETKVRRYRFRISVDTRRRGLHAFSVVANIMGSRYRPRIVSFEFESSVTELVDEISNG